MTGCLCLAPGRSHLYNFTIYVKIFEIKINKKGGEFMLKVSDKAVEKIKEELKEMSAEAKKPFIRLYMSVG